MGAASDQPERSTGLRQRVDEPIVLCVDLGTTGLKVGLLTPHGQVCWWGSTALHTDFGTPGTASAGAATQDAELWWQLVLDLAAQGLAAAGIDGRRIVGVAVTGQWASTVPIDETGRPVGPCLMWSDTRGSEHSAAVVAGPVAGYAPGALAAWLRRTGGIPSPSGADPLAHFLYLQRDRPKLTERTRWFLEPVDYLTQRFTGRAVATHASMTAAWLTDNRHLDALSYGPVLVRRSGVDAEKLPELVPVLSVVGSVTGEAATRLGLADGVAVVTGLPDLHNAVIASGAVGLFAPHAVLGTSAWVSCPLPNKRTDVIRQLAAVPGLGEGRYLLANNQDSAGRALDWWRGNLGAGADGDGALPIMADLIDAAASRPAGANGVMFTPWLTGERSPIDDRFARGGFHNLSVGTTQSDLTRAVLEGVGHNLRWLTDGAEKFLKRRFDSIRLLGGAARSDLWCQILADIGERAFERVADPVVAGLRGAALSWALATGEVSWDDVAELVPVDRTFTPDPSNREVYDRMYAEFPGLHRRNKGFFARLNR